MYSRQTDLPGTQLPAKSHSSSIMIQVHDFFNMGTTDMGDMGFTITPMGGGGSVQTVRYSTGWRAPEQDRKPSPKISKIRSQNYEEIKKQCLDQGALWEDPSFPAVNASVYHSYNLPYQFEWKRPSEICDDPQMFVGGATRFDVVQGELGNCWFLAAVGSLCATKSKELLHRVIPLDNSFAKGQYAGVFHFKIWQYGKWMDVVVDDRLPTLNGRLQYLHSPSNNEFWAALLEKAYAKLCASYEALSGGSSSEAMEDFTGGIVEHYELTKNVPDDLFNIMKKCYERQSLLCTSIDSAGMALESELPTGLVVGHAYSVTAVKSLKVRGHDVQLVRIRNPWGNKVEWNGAWSDKSSEWNMLGENERQELGLSFEDDGEFWMSYPDFTRNFHKLEICLLTPGTLCEERGRRWELTSEDGSWKQRVNAGGCRNYLNTFWTNPQYRIRVADRDDDSDEFGTVIVAIIQKERRKKKKEGFDLLTIGYSIYKVPEKDTGPLDMNFFKYNASAAKCPTFTNLREVSGRHKLQPGYYVIIPCTFQPHEERDFLLRVFSEKKVTSGEVDEPTGLVGVKSETLEPIPQNVIGLNDGDSLGKSEKENRRRRALIVTQDDAEKENDIRVLFKKISGADKEVDAYELQEMLNSHFKKELTFGGFSLETTRSMVAMMDSDRSGKLGYGEFKKLWVDLRQWQKVFKEFDRDGNGSFDSHELREALNSAGFTVANATFAALVMRYSDPRGRITFDEFILCAVKIKTMFAIFLQMKGKKPVAEFTLDQFIQTTMYA